MIAQGADVSDILRDRGQEPGGLQQMAVVSVVVHIAFLAAMVFVPQGWLSPDPNQSVMTISLGDGAPGL